MRDRRNRALLTLTLAALGAILAGCASGEFADTTRFWGDHAAAVVFGDDPSRD